MQWGEGREVCPVGSQLLQHPPAPDLAVRAAGDLDGRHAPHEGLRILARLRVRCRHRQQLPSQRQPLRLGRRGQQAVGELGVLNLNLFKLKT